MAAMRILPALATLALAAVAAAEAGQGPADPDAKVEGLNLGTYWYGAKITHEDLVGKVVLVEIWGS
jgi:hypothetical protein